MRLLVFLLFASLPVRAQEVYFTPSLDCEKAIIRHIGGAQSVHAAIYSITNPRIVSALEVAHRRGVDVAIVSDRLQAAGKYSKIKNLKEAGIPIRLNTSHKIEHNKFAVFDGTVVTGSYNWTSSASARNSENCVFFADPDGRYEERFQYLWELYNPHPNR